MLKWPVSRFVICFWSLAYLWGAGSKQQLGCVCLLFKVYQRFLIVVLRLFLSASARRTSCRRRILHRIHLETGCALTKISFAWRSVEWKVPDKSSCRGETSQFQQTKNAAWLLWRSKVSEQGPWQGGEKLNRTETFRLSCCLGSVLVEGQAGFLEDNHGS